MRKMKTAVFTLLFLFSFSPLLLQVTNFTINGSGTNFAMTSGDTIHWNYSPPVGATAIGELWIDLNVNHVIDPGTDRRLFIFGETDVMQE